jgi:surface antigen
MKIWKTATGICGAIALFASTVILSSGTPANACAPGIVNIDQVTQTSDPIAGYSGDQLQNAAAIMNAATGMGLTAQAQTIGVMTAMGESSLHNLDHGDTAGPDSRGLFQQRDSWGSLQERMNPTTAATLFYTRLEAVEGWQQMAPSAAAHAVQINADPDHYTPYFAPAAAIVDGLTNRAGAGACGNHQQGDDYPWPDQKTIKEGGGLSPLGYYYRECTDFVAWRLNRDAGNTGAPWKYRWSQLTPLGGDAIDWKKNWISHGWGVSDTPTPGSVAYWGQKAGSKGHVAYVQSVDPRSGTVMVEEYNWGGKHLYDTRAVREDVPDAFLAPPPQIVGAQ